MREKSKDIIQAIVLLLMMLTLSVSLVAQNNSRSAPSELPLLDAGFHLGTTFYGSGRIPVDELIKQRMADAAAHGMNAFTFYEDWRSLEPEEGHYQLNDLEATLDWLENSGLTPLLNITLVDIETLEGLPTDLVDAEGTTLAEGMAFDNPKIVARLNALLDQVVPLLVERKGFLLLLGNEVDRYFQEVNPEALNSYAQLVREVREHIHGIAPQLAVGVTLTGGEILQQTEVFQTLRSVTDIIPFNYYPLDDEFNILALADIPATLDAYIQRYGDNNPIVIQELGCPSGEALGSSLSYQSKCIDIMLETLQTYPQVRFVSIFTLSDWDEATCDDIMDGFGFTEEGLPDGYVIRIREFLCTLGLLDYDGTPKPAYTAFLAALQNIH